MTYSDDRHGQMRVHEASRRAHLACNTYTRDELRDYAKAHGLKLASLRKRDLAWHMAQNGLIDLVGCLRDGFPPAEGDGS